MLATAGAGVVMIVAAVAGVLALQGAVLPATVGGAGDRAAGDRPRAAPASGESSGSERSNAATDAGGSAAGGADGVLPDGATPFDDRLPGIARLDDDLLGALRAAARDAARDDVEILVNSGWRSPAYQDELLREAVAEYGSAEEAARWVATASTSSHVSGKAVDVGPAAATTWLSEHGATYGLCQVYRNEPWHYELRAGTADHGCPAMYADPTEDPRMQ